MRKFVYECWIGVMDADYNPLRHIPDLQVRHLVLQLLAWMWCLTFGLMVGSWYVWGISVIIHIALIVAIVITVATFQLAKRDAAVFNFMKGYHSYGRARGSVWIDGKKVNLPKGDPGGEHE